jgi:DNA-binding XRE family transcriptional regulator
MPNIGNVLREEILRLARKEYRNQNAATKKAAAQHRRDIAELKRQVATLQRTVSALSNRSDRSDSVASTSNEGKLRFVAKGLRSHRARLGLSARDLGKLVGVSAQSVYSWEAGKALPRREQIAKIAAIRIMGKREALRKLSATR